MRKVDETNICQRTLEHLQLEMFSRGGCGVTCPVEPVGWEVGPPDTVGQPNRLHSPGWLDFGMRPMGLTCTMPTKPRAMGWVSVAEMPGHITRGEGRGRGGEDHLAAWIVDTSQ